MATISLDPSLQLKTCPYNPCHRVKSSRFQRHVSECAKQCAAKGVTLRVCPFNADHRIPEDQFAEHCLDCRDGRQTIRSIYETPAIKVPKPEGTSTDWEWQTQDVWSDEYLTDDQSMTKTYGILNNDNPLTAEQLFELRFGANGKGETFTDTLYLNLMSYEERKKYNALCVDRIRGKKDMNPFNGLAKNETQTKGSNDSIEVLDISETEVTTTAKKQKTQNDVFRAPNSNPFADRLKGVGIGSSNRAEGTAKAVPTTGIGRGRVPERQSKSN